MKQRTAEENKELIESMPFLLPRNGFNGEIDDDYDFSYTELDMAEIPEGWENLLYNYCLEITPILAKANELENFHFLQIKEKWGELCIYNSGVNLAIADELDAVEKKYVDMSKQTCCLCGKAGKMTYVGWICPFCKDCWETIRRENVSYEDAINRSRRCLWV